MESFVAYSEILPLKLAELSEASYAMLTLMHVRIRIPSVVLAVPTKVVAVVHAVEIACQLNLLSLSFGKGCKAFLRCSTCKGLNFCFQMWQTIVAMQSAPK